MQLKLDYKSFLAKLMAKFSLVLWLFLALVILAEAWVIKASVDKVLTANDLTQFSSAQLTRVNFNTYESIDKRLTENSAFLPEEPNTADPFGLGNPTDD